MQKKFNVCFVTEDFYPKFIGGQGIYGFKFISELAKKGHTVTILAENREGRREFWKRVKNVSIFIVPFCFGNQLVLAFFEYLAFRLSLGEKYFDILHANQLSGLFFVIFRPKNVGKIIVSAHNTYYEMSKETKSFIKKIFYQPLIFLERIVYKKADGVLCNGTLEKEILKNNLHIKNLIKVVPLGVDIPKFSLNDRKITKRLIRKKLNLPLDAKIVLYVGRLVKRKNVDLIINAVNSMQDSKTVAVIIGKGSEVDNLLRIVSGNILILGFVEDTAPYFLAADLFITVSAAEGGFSLSVLEAASFGLPLIISSSIAGFPIIRPGVNGYIVDVDPLKLAEKIQMVLKKSKEMGDKSLSIAKQFSWERCVRETTDFYSLLLEKQ